MINETQVDQQDVKRILIERDITTLKQAFCRIICTEIRNNDTRIFVPHRLLSQDDLQSYLFNKELGWFGLQLLEPENYNVYNRMVDLVIHELVSDGTITKQQQKESIPDDPEERYKATQKLDRICKDLEIADYHFNWINKLYVK
jgi:hypothetical protein